MDPKSCFLYKSLENFSIILPVKIIKLPFFAENLVSLKMPRLTLFRNLAKTCSLGFAPRRAMILPPCSHSRLYSTDPPEHQPPSNEPWIPEYFEKFNEPIEDKRNRLVYQSRKRGMLENGLLLGNLPLNPYKTPFMFIIQEVLPISI